jgi:hypothetical protein
MYVRRAPAPVVPPEPPWHAMVAVPGTNLLRCEACPFTAKRPGALKHVVKMQVPA